MEIFADPYGSQWDANQGLLTEYRLLVPLSHGKDVWLQFCHNYLATEAAASNDIVKCKI